MKQSRNHGRFCTKRSRDFRIGTAGAARRQVGTAGSAARKEVGSIGGPARNRVGLPGNGAAGDTRNGVGLCRTAAAGGGRRIPGALFAGRAAPGRRSEIGGCAREYPYRCPLAQQWRGTYLFYRKFRRNKRLPLKSELGSFPGYGKNGQCLGRKGTPGGNA